MCSTSAVSTVLRLLRTLLCSERLFCTALSGNPHLLFSRFNLLLHSLVTHLLHYLDVLLKLGELSLGLFAAVSRLQLHHIHALLSQLVHHSHFVLQKRSRCLCMLFGAVQMLCAILLTDPQCLFAVLGEFGETLLGSFYLCIVITLCCLPQLQEVPDVGGTLCLQLGHPHFCSIDALFGLNILLCLTRLRRLAGTLVLHVPSLSPFSRNIRGSFEVFSLFLSLAHCKV
mmetsp:Transcript_3207/g.5792  ORF Transcript_3207/g.5792 Transcript_3207/m.5792 type:complete len:228 (-) Transcript_3207:990-1673(-)